MTNIEIAQLINQRIGDRPVPFESVRAIALEIYREVGGTEDDENFEDIYAILLAILPLAHPGGSQIDDHDISTGKTWSSFKIVSELGEYATLDDVSNFLTIPNALATFPTKNDVSIYATWNAVNTSLGLKQDTLIAGDNITINNNVISASVGESPDMSNYYTKDEVDASLATKADKTELEDYATKDDISTFLEPNDVSNFLTANDTSIYATKSDVDTSFGNYYTKSEADEKYNPYNIAEGPNQDGYVLPYWNSNGQITGPATAQMDVPEFRLNGQQGYTGFLAPYNFGNLTRFDIYVPTNGGTAGQCLVSNGDAEPTWQNLDLSTYATKNDISTFLKPNDVSAFITANDASIYAIKSDVDDALATKADASDLNNYATKDDISTFLELNDVSIYAVKSDVDTSFGNYYTKAEIDNALAGKADDSDLANYPTKSDVNTSLGNYYTKSEIDASLATKADAADLSNYATKTYVDSSLALKANQTYVDSSLNNKANTSYVDNNFAKLVICTQSQYNNLQVKDPSTLYIISDVS